MYGDQFIYATDGHLKRVGFLIANFEELLEQAAVGAGVFIFEQPKSVCDRGHECLWVGSGESEYTIQRRKYKLLQVLPLPEDLFCSQATQNY